MDADYWQFLPISFNYPNHGLIDIDDALRKILQFLKTQEYKDAAYYVNVLALYQITYGFWNANVETRFEQSEKLLAELERKTNELSELNMRHDVQFRNMLNDAKVRESSIKALMDKANDSYNNMLKTQENVNVNLENIKGVVARADDMAESILKRRDENNKIADELLNKSTTISEQLNASQKLINDAKVELENVEKKTKESLDVAQKNNEKTNGYVEEIKKMIGFVADGTLSHSFNKRKENINDKARFWLILSGILLLAAIIWIIFVFTELSAATGIVWADILINAIKSSLGVFAFGYALNEYGKERNLQEEYAFKESVALTLTAYLQQLESCDKEEMKNLLVETVNKLYTKPVISTKEYKMMNVDTKDITDKLQPVVDLVKSVTEIKKE